MTTTLFEIAHGQEFMWLGTLYKRATSPNDCGTDLECLAPGGRRVWLSGRYIVHPYRPEYTCVLCERELKDPAESRAVHTGDYVCRDARGCQARLLWARHYKEFDAKTPAEQAREIRTLSDTNLDEYVRRVDPTITRGGRETDAEFRARAVRLIAPERAPTPVPLHALRGGTKFTLGRTRTPHSAYYEVDTDAMRRADYVGVHVKVYDTRGTEHWFLSSAIVYPIAPAHAGTREIGTLPRLAGFTFNGESYVVLECARDRVVAANMYGIDEYFNPSTLVIPDSA